jgi:methyl-accepting chemotaxis protein
MEVLGIFLKASGMVGTIFQVSQFLYNYINKVKTPEELMRECKGSFGDLNRRLDEIYVGTDQLSDKMEDLALTTSGGFDQLSGRVEGLAQITASGFERVSEAFSQVIAL